MKKLLAFLALNSMLFGFDCDLENLQGYSVIAVKQVYDDFEGCDFDKKIIFTDDTYVVCNTYSYTYSYMPKAIILGNGFDYKMCVNDRLYSIRLQ